MEEVGEDVAAVEAIALVGPVVMKNAHMSAHMAAVVLVDEMMIGTVTKSGAEGIEAEVLDTEDEAEALQEGEIEVLLLERTVLKEGLRLSSGTGRENILYLIIEMAITSTTTGTTMAMQRVEVNMMMMISTTKSIVDIHPDQIDVIWLEVCLLKVFAGSGCYVIRNDIETSSGFEQ